jgi:hypothetical protein
VEAGEVYQISFNQQHLPSSHRQLNITLCFTASHQMPGACPHHPPSQAANKLCEPFMQGAKDRAGSPQTSSQYRHMQHNSWVMQLPLLLPLRGQQHNKRGPPCVHHPD